MPEHAGAIPLIFPASSKHDPIADPEWQYDVAFLRFQIAAWRCNLTLKAGFKPDQPRDDRGRWTTGDDDGSDDAESTPQFILVGGANDRSGYPVDILEEDLLGGHTFERHVGKTEEYLKARILNSRTNLAGIITIGERRAGSFSSLEAANKLVNSTLAQNREKVKAFVERRFPSVLNFMIVFADFDSPTGYEAYASNDRSLPRMRATSGVTVHIRRTAESEKGYYVYSAWPANRD